MQKRIFGGKIRLSDLILVAVILVLTLSVFIFVELSKEKGEFVRVSVGNEVIGEYSLSADAEYTLNGGTNILVIKNGEAYIRWADCPRQLCVNHRPISYTSQRIVCAENNIVVEIIGSGEGILEV